VTITQVGANITHQRQNLGRTQVWGIQNDVEYRLGASWRLAAAYVYDQAKVTQNPANTSLVGKFLPQVPKHRGSAHLTYSDPKIASVAFGIMVLGMQFDDDQNSRVIPAPALSDAGYAASAAPGLPGYTIVDFSATRTIVRNVEAFFGVENVFDQTYFVGTLPTTIGSPRLINGGIRVRFSGR